MHFKTEIVFQAVGDFFLAVPVGEKTQDCLNYIKINYSCYFIAKCIERGLDMEDIVEEYMREFSIERSVAESDINYTIGGLREMGFID